MAVIADPFHLVADRDHVRVAIRVHDQALLEVLTLHVLDLPPGLVHARVLFHRAEADLLVVRAKIPIPVL